PRVAGNDRVTVRAKQTAAFAEERERARMPVERVQAHARVEASGREARPGADVRMREADAGAGTTPGPRDQMRDEIEAGDGMAGACEPAGERARPARDVEDPQR